MERINNSRESARTVHVSLWFSPAEFKQLDDECRMLKSNPSGKPLEMSKLIRDVCVAQYFAREETDKIDVKIYNYLKKKMGGG